MPVRSRDFATERYWAVATGELLASLGSTAGGLSSREASVRLEQHGRNELVREEAHSRLGSLYDQVKSPLLLLLLFAVVVSWLSHERTDAAIVLVIVVATVWFGYSRDRSTEAALLALRNRVRERACVLRDGERREVGSEEVVPGDVILLSAGSLVPADAVVLDSTDCHVSQALLTGESYPVEKRAVTSATDVPLVGRKNVLFRGTNVRSGTARGLVVRTGKQTEFGAIAHRLSRRRPETEFDRGLRRFGYLLTSAMLVLVVVVFGSHVLLGRPPIQTLLFSIALAVGLSPELLPAILSVNLARGAQTLAAHGVLVSRLNAIENLGSMDVLCTDKTGTLTEGKVDVEGAYDPGGASDDDVLQLAALNAKFSTGFANPLDEALLRAPAAGASNVTKRGELPFDFTRKRVSVVLEDAKGGFLLTKGSFRTVLAISSLLPDGTRLDAERRAELQRRALEWGRRGVRVLGVASRRLRAGDLPELSAESELVFQGFVTFLDRPKAGVANAIATLAARGVQVKIITGDSRPVAEYIAQLIALPGRRVLTGSELDSLSEEALWRRAEDTELFVEVDPNHKERIIRALKKAGHVVGFLGDGVNDAPAMHVADVSLSVDQAVDVARATADLVLLEPGLDVIRRGVEEGRKTFANTLKYVLTTTSANLGNMASMALASLFLPFLPLLPGQILLNNFLSDIPALGLADDRVDAELVNVPRRWDIRFVGRFMLEFGALSSLFDCITFAVLLLVFKASIDTFRTGWFVESLLTELVIAIIIRTRRPFFRSRPGRLLSVATLVLIPLTLALPFLPHARLLGFVPLQAPILAGLVAITLVYVVTAELTKAWFYRQTGRSSRAQTLRG